MTNSDTTMHLYLLDRATSDGNLFQHFRQLAHRNTLRLSALQAVHADLCCSELPQRDSDI